VEEISEFCTGTQRNVVTKVLGREQRCSKTSNISSGHIKSVVDRLLFVGNRNLPLILGTALKLSSLQILIETKQK
jgi:hypothetical protein